MFIYSKHNMIMKIMYLFIVYTKLCLFFFIGNIKLHITMMHLFILNTFIVNMQLPTQA